MSGRRTPITSVGLWLYCALPALVWTQALPAAPSSATFPMQVAEREHGHREKHGHGHHRRDEREGRPVMVAPMAGGIVFSPMQQHAARSYYLEDEHRGFVPPGLAKKGGMPPGQYKRWRVGTPLPTGVVYYALPGTLMLQLGPAPSGYRYVRVATDILMIAIGTGMVVDAIEDIVR